MGRRGRDFAHSASGGEPCAANSSLAHGPVTVTVQPSPQRIERGSVSDSAVETRQTRRSRLKKWLWIAGSVVVVYAVAGMLLVPWIIRSRVLSGAQTLLHRHATLTRVRFNPFTLKATLSGFDLRDQDGSRLFAFDTMVVNLSVASLPLRALALDEYRLIKPLVVVRIGTDGKLSVADLFAGGDTTHAADGGGPPARVQIARLALLSGEVDFIDNSRSPRYEEHFTDLGVQVDGLSTLPNRAGDHVLSAIFASGAQLAWSGHNTVEPLHLEGALKVSGVSLPRAAEILGGAVPLQLARGVGEAEVRYEVRHDSGQALTARLTSASFTATDLAVHPRDVPDDWARLTRLSVEGVSARYPERTAHIAAIRVEGPWLRAARRADSTIDWKQYLPQAPAKDTTPVKPPGPAWKVRLDSLIVADGAVQLTDSVVKPALEYSVDSIRATLAPVSTDSTLPIVLGAAAQTGRGSVFTATGSLTRSPYAGDIDLALKDLDLRVAQPYLREKIPAEIRSGKVSVAGKVRLRKAKPETAFDGRAALSRFELRDSVGDSLLAFRTVKVNGIHLTAAPDLLRIKQITVDSPFARIAISRDRTLNLTSLVPQSKDTGGTPYPYEIQEIAFTHGEIDFSDESLIIPFRARIDSTFGKVHDVASFGGTAGALQLEGKVEPYGLARANGTIMLSDPFAATDIRADFRNVDMTTLTPYSAQFAGYAIKQGKLDLDLDYHIKDRQLRAGHKIVATNLTLGEKVEGGESPGFLVKLAISLMKDREGRIKLDVPVEGTVDSPEFSYKGIVWQALKQMLGKVASAPFHFLGKLLGIGGDSPELVDFDPGRSDLIPPEKEKLDSLAAELGRKPDLILSVEGRYDSISDVAALREASLQRQIASRRDSLGKKEQSDTSTSMLAQIMSSLYESKFGKASRDSLELSFKTAWDQDTTHRGAKFDPSAYQAEVRARLLAAQPLEAGDLERLGRQRAISIVAALTANGGVDSTRVTATDPVPVKQKKAGSMRISSEMKMDAK